MNLTPTQLQTLRHMLGIDTPETREPLPTRDYYCANPGDPELLELQRLGAVHRYGVRDGYEWFTTTAAGRAAAMASHRTIRLSRPKRLYRRWLHVSDAVGCTFGQYLTEPEYAASRRLA